MGYGYPPAMVAVPEEHAPPDGRDRGAFGRWEAQRSKLEYAAHELLLRVGDLRLFRMSKLELSRST